jgi:hypothetical protein
MLSLEILKTWKNLEAKKAKLNLKNLCSSATHSNQAELRIRLCFQVKIQLKESKHWEQLKQKSSGELERKLILNQKI